MAKRDLAGKVAWITGGGTGIGQGAAEKLAEAGCHVILSGRRAGAVGGVSRCVAGRRRISRSPAAGCGGCGCG